MTRAEASKLLAHVHVAPPVDTISVPKLLAYVWAVPGISIELPTESRGQVHAQILRRR